MIILKSINIKCSVEKLSDAWEGSERKLHPGKQEVLSWSGGQQSVYRSRE